jgi:hypothetical protein
VIVIEIIVIALALVSLYFGARFLANKSWIMGWIRGSIGLLFISVTVFLGLAVTDFFSYENILAEQTLATLSIEELEEQRYKVTVEYILDSREESYELRGDLWQMDAKIIRWLGFFQAMGAKPGYRLDRISGRYYSLEDERRNDRTVYSLQEPKMGLDVWGWLQGGGSFVPWVDAVYGSATYLPLVDGAIYQVKLSNSGLTALPVNSVAKDAVGGNW